MSRPTEGLVLILRLEFYCVKDLPFDCYLVGLPFPVRRHASARIFSKLPNHFSLVRRMTASVCR